MATFSWPAELIIGFFSAETPERRDYARLSAEVKARGLPLRTQTKQKRKKGEKS
jgi:hypothetical protein